MKKIKKLFVIILLIFQTNNFVLAQQKIEIEGQSSEYTLYTNIDTSQLSVFNQLFTFEHFSKERLEDFKEFIKPYAYHGDPLGEYLYAKAFDLYPLGIENLSVKDTAMFYYKKAAEQNLVMAELFLFHAFKYGYMTIKVDNITSLKYLQRTIEHGDSTYKADGYKELAYQYYNGDVEGIKADTLKAKEMLEISLKYNPNDGRVIDFLAGIYADDGEYDKAIVLLLKSDNDQSRLQAAEWLIEGKKVKKNPEKGLHIIYKYAEEQIASGTSIHENMASLSSVYMLNKLYCNKIITREQLGKYYLNDFICD